MHTGISQKSISAILQSLTQTSTGVEVMTLNDSTPVPFNHRMLPVFICFEALIVGFVLGGVLLLSEKEEGVIRAMRISPLTAFRYISAKTILFSIIGAIYALLMAIFCVGVSFDWLQFLVLSLLGSALFTLMGLCFTAFFNDMSSWFFSASVLLAFNMPRQFPMQTLRYPSLLCGLSRHIQLFFHTRKFCFMMELLVLHGCLFFFG